MKQSTISSILMICVLCIAAYGAYNLIIPLFNAPPKQPQQKLKGFAVYLQRKGCFGACTRYAVMIHGSGKTGYVGVSHVKLRGPKNAHVSRDKVKKLLEEAQKIKFFNFQDEYRPGDGRCHARAAAARGAVVGVTLQNTTKVLHLNFGCPTIPAKLRKFMRDIDAAAGTARWIGKPPRQESKTI